MKHRVLIIAFAALVVTLSSGQFGQWRPSTSNCCPQGGCPPQATYGRTYVAPRTTAPRSTTQVPVPSRIVSPFVWSKPEPPTEKPPPGPLAPVEPAKPKPQSPGGPQLQACEDKVAALHKQVETLQDKLETLTQNFIELRKECRITDDELPALAKRIQGHLDPIHVKVEVLDRPPENPQFEQDVYLGGTLPLRLFPVPPKPE